MIQKQPININFAQGMDEKSDPKAIPLGKFAQLTNSVFTKQGLLQKRNGFGPLPQLPDTLSTYTTTFQDGLIAIGPEFRSLSSSIDQWINKGSFQPVFLSVLPTVRSALSQVQCDSITASNGLACTVYTEINGGSTFYKYTIIDSDDGEIIVGQTPIPVGSGTITGSPRVFILGGYFLIIFTNTISGSPDLQYIAISTSSPTTVVKSNTTIAGNYSPSDTLSWDAVVVNEQLYVCYNTASGGQQVDFIFLDSSFNLSAVTSFSGRTATSMSVVSDLTQTSPVIYAAFWDSASSTGYAVAVNTGLQILMTPTEWLASGSVGNVTSIASQNILTIIYENLNNYSYDSSIPTNFISSNTVTLPLTVTTGTVGTANVVLRSVGLASKAFSFNSRIYVLSEYSSVFQPTYFLIDLSGNIIEKFGYENGGGSTTASSSYLPFGLPNAQVIDDTVTIPYLYKDLISSVNKAQGVASAEGVYSQTGVNLSFTEFTAETLSTAELGNNLNISGGYLYAYDGAIVTEQNFHVWPDDIEATWSATGGAIQAQPDGTTNTDAYFYQVIYQWTDAQGNIINSAPSIPISVTTTGSLSTGSITLTGPYLRLTNKPDVKIVIYRWSVAQENYFQVTSISSPLLNDPTMDSWSYTDVLADSAILGNGLIYTTGGVLEDVGTSACTAITIFDTRLWVVSSEDPNLLLFSKQVIEGTPVEMSDLLSFYVAPNAGTTTSTGPMKCLSPMDDKLIIFKKDALYFINGAGPDNTGANSQYSQSIFITSTVGSENQNSIAFIPQGLMFQSDKGIWLLGRDLSTAYIGAPVENSNAQLVTSALSIPGTTQARFTLDNKMTLMYDYYFQQWGTFNNTDVVSSTSYEGLHTYISSLGGVFQETPGIYLDNGNPVLLSFTTGWLNLAGLQGYQRVFALYLLGTYLTPHLLHVGIAYDYNSSLYQNTSVSPTNFSSSTPSSYGDTPAPFGSKDNIESWRVFTAKQRCSSAQITLQESYDPSFGIPAGAGFTLSGMNVLVGIKSGWRTVSQGHTTGSGVNRG